MKEVKGFIGIDVGSVSTNLVFLDMEGELLAPIYRRTNGKPIQSSQAGLRELEAELKQLGIVPIVLEVGVTGSAREIIAVVVGAGVMKNEITAHGLAARHANPDVATVLEIGGQDSKIIILVDGAPEDFSMNTVCAAGTGSFLDHQSQRLGVGIEDFGFYATTPDEKGNLPKPASIAGRCGVFAESDMIHKQQIGIPMDQIIYGLCTALVRNYLSTVAKGMIIKAPVVFQGGVAANSGMKRAFEEALGLEVEIPPHWNVKGAIGGALLARRKWNRTKEPAKFRGFSAADLDLKTSTTTCEIPCANNCEIIQISQENGDLSREVLARLGGKCEKGDFQS